MQTPRTVPKGRPRFGLGVEFESVRANATATARAVSVTVPQFEFFARYGLTDNVDIGGKIYPIGAELGLKYQFVRGYLDVAVAPAASYSSVDNVDELEWGAGGGHTVSAIHLHLPLLMGLNLRDDLMLSFGPKLLYAIVSGTTTGNFASNTTPGLWVGGYVSLPIRIRKRPALWIAPEINVYRPLGADALIYQGGLAILFGGAAHSPPILYSPPPAPPADAPPPPSPPTDAPPR